LYAYLFTLFGAFAFIAASTFRHPYFLNRLPIRRFQPLKQLAAFEIVAFSSIPDLIMVSSTFLIEVSLFSDDICRILKPFVNYIGIQGRRARPRII
jgi:hypothetical protein